MDGPRRYWVEPRVIDAIQWTGDNTDAVLEFGRGVVDLLSYLSLIHI